MVMTRKAPDHPLRKWRKIKGYTLEEAATLVGTSRQVWSDWERGRHRPGTLLMPKVRAVTGLSADIFYAAAPRKSGIGHGRGGTWDQRPGALEATRSDVREGEAYAFAHRPLDGVWGVLIMPGTGPCWHVPHEARVLARQLLEAADVAEGGHAAQVAE
jgi:transcriptional regulator with XRE-family HTH domain